MIFVTLLLPPISHKKVEHTCSWQAPVTLSPPLVPTVLGTRCLNRRLAWGLTLAAPVPPVHCGLPADFLNSSRAIDNVLPRFSLSVNTLHYRLHFLPYCIEEEKEAGLVVAHFKLLYLYLGVVRLGNSEPDPQACCRGIWKCALFNTTVKWFRRSLVTVRSYSLTSWHTLFCKRGSF